MSKLIIALFAANLGLCSLAAHAEDPRPGEPRMEHQDEHKAPVKKHHHKKHRKVEPKEEHHEEHKEEHK